MSVPVSCMYRHTDTVHVYAIEALGAPAVALDSVDGGQACGITLSIEDAKRLRKQLKGVIKEALDG